MTHIQIATIITFVITMLVFIYTWAIKGRPKHLIVLISIIFLWAVSEIFFFMSALATDILHAISMSGFLVYFTIQLVNLLRKR